MAANHLDNRDGITIIEVILSVFLLTVGLLAIAQVQFVTTVSGQDSLGRTLAEAQAIDLGERMWLNLPDPLSAVDGWETEHESSLPGWGAEVEEVDDRFFLIRIAWGERGFGANGPAYAHYVRLPEVE